MRAGIIAAAASLLAGCIFDTSGVASGDAVVPRERGAGERVERPDAPTVFDLPAPDATTALDPRPDAALPSLDPKPDAPTSPDLKKLDQKKPDLPQPDLPKPDLPKPDLPKPDLPKPDLPKPDLKPDLPKPDLPKPDTTPLTCTQRYGTVPSYLLCTQTATSCRFYTNANGSTCQGLCAARGGACITSCDEGGAGSCNCDSLETSCTSNAYDKICTCTRP